MLHRDRVRVRIVRYDRKGRPEGRVLDILERRKAPIIGRLLHESGMWLVAPEDRRYGQDILIPKNATANATAGQVVAVELTEPPSMFSQPVGRVVEVLGEIDDPGMEIEIAVRKYEVPHRFSPETMAQAAALPDQRAPGRPAPPHRPERRAAGHDRRRGRARLRRRGVLRADQARPRQDARRGWRLVVAIADVSHYVKPGEPIDDDAYERATSVYFPRRVIPMLPEKLSNGLCSLNPERGSPVRWCATWWSTRDGEIARLPVLPGGDLLAGALHLHRGGGDPRQHARPRGAAAQRAGAAPAAPARGLPRAAEAARARAARSISRPPRRRSSADDNGRIETHRAAQAQRGAPADRGGDAGGQRVRGRIHRRRTSTRRCTACTKGRRPKSASRCRTT